MKLTWNTLTRMVHRVVSPRTVDHLDLDALKEIAREIATAHPDEIGCAECFEQMDRFVEMTLAGENAVAAIPLVQDHLDRCCDCHEEFEALLVALHAVA